jgi:hypothetical protein
MVHGREPSVQGRKKEKKVHTDIRREKGKWFTGNE